MVIVTVPIIAMLVIILCKKIPKIGGNIFIALLVAGFLSLLLGGIYHPANWIMAFVDGLNRISWVLCLSIFGSIYSETQVELGTVNTIMSTLKAKFHSSPKALVICVVLVLVVAGSLLGDAIAASTVIGALTIGTLAAIGLSGNKICAIIVMGASMGSIMPPMTQALALSSSLVGANPDEVLGIGYFTVGLIVALTCLYIYLYMLKDIKKTDIENRERPIDILRKNWTTLIPLLCLIIVMFFRTINGPLKFDLMTWLLSSIPVGETNLIEFVKGIPILSGVVNGIVLSIIFAAFVSFCFPKVHRNTGKIMKESFTNVRATLLIQLCAGFMLGSFYAGGQIEAVRMFAEGLNENLLKWGGSGALTLIGMLTGSQSTAQNVVFSFFGPTLVQAGVSDTMAAIAGAHIAAAGQGAPPADLTTFVVAGIVGGAIGKKVDPIKSMFYSLPMCIFLFIVGIVALYI